ncbi:MAG: serine hydrolase family protein [Candidatus Micrarchaeota archaeon]|nr:serine hydrolase family protein [Candidatus Micrarchaeota archaeon]
MANDTVEEGKRLHGWEDTVTEVLEAGEANRAFIVHGWNGRTDEGWFPWLKAQLTARGFAVSIPPMPNPERPAITEWVRALSEAVGVPDESTYLVGHSLGCQAILRYLAELRGPVKIGGAVLVAGWAFSRKAPFSEDEEKERELMSSWLNTPIDWLAAVSHCNGFAGILSDDDPFVPFEETRDVLRKNLGAEIIVEQGRGHLSEENRVFELQSVLDTVLKMAGMRI